MPQNEFIQNSVNSLSMNYLQLSINCQFDKLAIDLLGLGFDKTGLHQVHLSKGNRPVIFFILLF